MKRSLTLAILLVRLLVSSSQANFGLFRRQTEVRYYYAPPVYVVPNYQPVFYPFIETAPAVVFPQPAPITTFPAVPAVPALPPRGTIIQQATPTPAPPSITPEPPMGPTGTTSFRVSDRFYDLYSGATRMAATSDLCSVAFWNLSGQTMTVRVDGRDVVLAPNRSVTLDLPRNFTWQVAGRAAEVAQINSSHSAA